MTVEEELEAIEIDWTLGVAENFQRVQSAALAALEAANKLADEAERDSRNRDMWKGQCERQSVELTALRSRVDELEDKIDGLESELSSAVDVLFWRGDDEAREWVRLNYPKQYAALKKEPVQ